MSGDVRIEPCSFHDLDAVQRFIHDHWRAGHILSRDRELLLWQYDPHRATSLGFEGPSILLARSGEQIIGMLGIIPAEFNFRGHCKSGAWMAILNVVPEARSTLAGLKLLNVLPSKGLQAIAVLGINEHVAQVYRGLKYELLADLPRWVAVVDEQASRALLPSDASPHSLDDLCERHRLPTDINDNGVFDVRSIDHLFGAEWDEFELRSLGRLYVGTRRSAAYLNWRYTNHPSFRYTRLLARTRHREKAGLAIYRLETPIGHHERVMRVVEFLGEEGALRALAARIAIDAREHRVAFADFYCASERFARPLADVGFHRQWTEPEKTVLPCRLQPIEHGAFPMRGAFLISRDVSEFSGRLLAADDLYITKSDGDMDRPN